MFSRTQFWNSSETRKRAADNSNHLPLFCDLLHSLYQFLHQNSTVWQNLVPSPIELIHKQGGNSKVKKANGPLEMKMEPIQKDRSGVCPRDGASGVTRNFWRGLLTNFEGGHIWQKVVDHLSIILSIYPRTPASALAELQTKRRKHSYFNNAPLVCCISRQPT